VRVLSRLFRGLFLNALNNAHQQGELCFLGSLADLRDYRFFRQYLRPVSRKEWVVYSKPPFGGPANVLKYLSRYTHRVAIANSRLVSMNDGSVSFRWKDYSNGGRQRIMTLDAVEFIRRFLLHVLPKGFVRIRHYGLFANRHRKERIELSRRLLGSETPAKPIEEDEHDATPIRLEHPKQCPRCKVGRLMLVDLQPVHSVYVLSPVWNDTS
jgi:hypothetical protein